MCCLTWCVSVCACLRVSHTQEEGPADEAELDDETWAKNVTAGGNACGGSVYAMQQMLLLAQPPEHRLR
jgi:hypothetical protein